MAPAASGGWSQSRGLARPPTPASGWPVPVLARWRHEIGETVEELIRRELDDAVGSRPRGLARAARPDPVGGFGSGQHVADGGCGRVGVPRHACGRTQQSLDICDEDSRESGDGRRPIGEKTPQSLRHGDHPLSHGHRRDDVIGEVGGGLGHAPSSRRVGRAADWKTRARTRARSDRGRGRRRLRGP